MVGLTTFIVKGAAEGPLPWDAAIPFKRSRTPTLVPAQSLFELYVADVDLDAFASVFERLTAAGITFTTLHER